MKSSWDRKRFLVSSCGRLSWVVSIHTNRLPIAIAQSHNCQLSRVVSIHTSSTLADRVKWDQQVSQKEMWGPAIERVSEKGGSQLMGRNENNCLCKLRGSIKLIWVKHRPLYAKDQEWVFHSEELKGKMYLVYQSMQQNSFSYSCFVFWWFAE